MRALFTCHPVIGCFLPLTPVARAMVEAGHDVLFGTPVFFRPAVEAAGFRWVRAGVENDDPEMAAVRARMSELRGEEQRRYVHTHVFGDVRPRRLVPDILALAESWRPDIFVHDSAECGAMIAAELLGIPHATVEVHPTAASVFKALLDKPLQSVRATFGLPPRSIQELLDEYLTLVQFPPSLTPVGAPTVPVTRHFRGLPPDDGTIDLPAWLDRIGPRPLVYVSLGTVFSRVRGSEIFSKLLAGLQDADVEVVATVGHDLDPATLGPQPEHIHLERFLPLGELLPRCSLALFHGGSGTLGHAIANGLPMVIVPVAADQPENAARCAELGASRTLDQDDLTPEFVREVVLDVLHTPSYRQSAERLRDELDALPGVDHAVELLERLARAKRPTPAARQETRDQRPAMLTIWRVGRAGAGREEERMVADDLVGSWKLVAWQVVADGQARDVFGAEPTGCLLLTREGRAMVLTVATGREAGESDAERAALHRSMVSYTGRYRVEGDELITTVEASWNESWTGTEQRRRFRIEGNRLFIESAPAPSIVSPGAIDFRRIVWEREPGS